MNKLIIFLIFSSLTAFSFGRDIYVATNGAGDGSSSYGTWGTASSNIEWAVNVGVNDDTVWISNGVYVLTNQITVTSNITVRGFTNNGPAIIDGNGTVRCFEFTAAATGVLANLFITRGYVFTGGYSGGGGVKMGSGVLLNCVFSNNSAFSSGTYAGGGGAYFAHGTNLIQSCVFVDNITTNTGGGLFLRDTSRSIIDRCVFRTNTADIGGGVYHKNDCNNTLITNCDFICNVASNRAGGGCFYFGTNNLITHCTFDGNAALKDYGGGMYMLGSGWLCSDSFFSNNIATNSGGGMSLRYGAVVKNCVIARNVTQVTDGNNGGGGIHMGEADTLVQNCTIEENRSGQYAGGVYFVGGILQNCLIKNNVADWQAGAIRVSATDTEISSCTIVSNYATSYGGGIHNRSATYTVRVDNCIVYLNKSANNPPSSNLYDLSSSSYSNCCVAGFVNATAVITNNITTANPQFSDWTNGNYRLSRNSLCVNAGVNRDWMTNAVDLDGHRRVDIFSGLPDMGCYEYVPVGASTVKSFRGDASH